MKKPIKIWTRKTKVALIVSIAIAIFAAVWWGYVWPGQLIAIPIGAFVFLFIALFNPRGIGYGILAGIGLFFLLVPLSESLGTILLPVITISMVLVAAIEKRIGRP